MFCCYRKVEVSVSAAFSVLVKKEPFHFGVGCLAILLSDQSSSIPIKGVMDYI